MNKQDILVIVHPGSACGSADDNLGRDTAEFYRLEMQLLVEGWEGPVLVLDGDLSDELDGWRGAWQRWGQAINTALEDAAGRNQISKRVMANDGSDYNQEVAIADLVDEFHLTPNDTTFTLTGAWVEGDEDGCVHSVRKVLEEKGFSVRVEDAMDIEASLEDEETMEDEEDTLPSPPVSAGRKPKP